MAPKIDIQAIQTELQGISSLMTEVTRLMSPQTWQGGSAASFTTDLQGHNRSLSRMMHQVMKTASELNHAPLALTTPEIPRTNAPSGTPGVASISPSALERLETALTRSADGLPAHGRRIRSLLAVAGPGIAGTNQCDRTAAWCHEQAGRMRTRIRYARAEEETGKAFAVNGMPWVPDVERFGSQEMGELGSLQAAAFAKNLRDPKSTPADLLAEIGRTLRENAKNSAYLNAFFRNVPAGSVGKLAYTLHQRRGEALNKNDKSLLADVGTALGALSRTKNGQAAVTQALGPIGSDLPGQALLVKLSAPEVKWSSAVLVDLAKAALRWRQKYPSYAINESTGIFEGDPHTSTVNQPNGRWWTDWGLGKSFGRDPDLKTLRDYDPALNILGRIAQQNDTTAARELAATQLEKALVLVDAAAEKAKPLTWLSRGSGGTYASLLIAPDWMDGGTIAGKVITLATTPVKGHEVQASGNAAEIMKTVAWWNDKGRDKAHKFLDAGILADYNPIASDSQAPKWFPHDGEIHFAELGPGVRDGLLQMTRMHIAAIADADLTASGTELPEGDSAISRIYTSISGEDMQKFLRTLVADDKAWTQLAVDTQAYRQRVYAWGLKEHRMRSAKELIGYLEGNLIAAYGRERIGREVLTQKEYEDAKKHLGTLRDIGGAILASTPASKVPGLTDAYAMGTDLGLEKIKYADLNKNIEKIEAETSKYSDQLYLDLAQALEIVHGPHGTGDKELDEALKNWRRHPDQQNLVVKATKEYELTRPGAVDRIFGRDIVAETNLYVDHNNPRNRQEPQP